MSQQLTKMELREIVRFLKKVYPGVEDQDDLWNLINKVEQQLKGDNETSHRRSRDTPKGA
jgi:hypothetical protein